VRASRGGSRRRCERIGRKEGERDHAEGVRDEEGGRGPSPAGAHFAPQQDGDRDAAAGGCGQASAEQQGLRQRVLAHEVDTRVSAVDGV
jgi:hypothetical protein